jgi:hypothetical protein
MLISTAELREFEEFRSNFSSLKTGNEQRAALSEFFTWRDDLLLAVGFDEIRYVPTPIINVGQVTIVTNHDPAITTYLQTSQQPVLFSKVLRSVVNGAWYIFGSSFHRNEIELAPENGFWIAKDVVLEKPVGIAFVPYYLNGRKNEQHGQKNVETGIYSLDDLVVKARATVSSAGFPATLLLHNLSRSPEQHPTIELVDSVKALLLALKEERKSLQEISWQQLEDIVAELLRARGMQVTVTSRSGDGGRDVIARGELIPGEPAVLAVEVKHKPVVKVGDLRNALYANREFPALLFVTSGRFSAGVIQEKWKPDNFLRLLLKDGIALRQWIDAYREDHDHRQPDT